MDIITHPQVQDLVGRLPSQKLPLAYNILADLLNKDESLLSPQLNIMLLPLYERKKIMTKQAEKMVAHYKDNENERQAWQSGDFVNEY
jgi:hypothetical protein